MAMSEHGPEPTEATPSIVAVSSDRELVVTRTLDAPRPRVFEAWTDPVHVAHWWGPNGFTNTVVEMDVRPGGGYRIVMRSPDGVEYPLKGFYREILAPERLVATENWDEHPAAWRELLEAVVSRGTGRAAEVPREALEIVTFEEDRGKTKLTIRTRFESAAVREAMLTMGVALAWGESLDRLERHLART